MTIRRKTAMAVAALEKHFGVPQWEGPEQPLDTLVRTILSQNTTDVNSGRAYEKLKAEFPTWEAAFAAGPARIEAAIRCGGLARQKSRRIHDLLGWVHQRFGSFDLGIVHEMPTQAVFEALLPLKGIGPKTIAVMLLFACGRDCFAVDTHVHRIVRRLGLVPHTASPERTFHLMKPLVPPGKALSFHLNLLSLGRTLCRPSEPKCPTCPLRRICDYAKLHGSGTGITASRASPLSRAGQPQRQRAPKHLSRTAT